MEEIKSKLIKEKIKQVYHTCKCRHVPQTPAKKLKNQITNVLEYFCLFGRNYIHFYNSGLNPLISHYLSSREWGGGGGRERRSHMVFGVTVGGSVVVNRVHKGEATEN